MSEILLREFTKKYSNYYFKKKKVKNILYSVDLMDTELQLFNDEFMSFINSLYDKNIVNIYNSLIDVNNFLKRKDLYLIINSIDEALKKRALSADDVSGFDKFNEVSGVIVESLFTFVSDKFPILKSLVDTLREFKDISILLTEKNN